MYSGNADFNLGWHVTSQGLRNYRVVYEMYGYSWSGWGANGFGTDTSDAAVHEWAPGTVIIDVVDGRTDRLVWRGMTQGALADEPDPEKRQEMIDSGVRKILADFPPQD